MATAAKCFVEESSVVELSQDTHSSNMWHGRFRYIDDKKK